MSDKFTPWLAPCCEVSNLRSEQKAASLRAASGPDAALPSCDAPLLHLVVRSIWFPHAVVKPAKLPAQLEMKVKAVNQVQ